MPEDLRIEQEALEARIADLTPDVSRGERATALLENDLLRAAFEEVRGVMRVEVLALAPKAVDPKVSEHIKTLGHKLEALDLVEEQIRHHINTGKIRGEDLKRDRSRLEQIQGFFRRRAA